MQGHVLHVVGVGDGWVRELPGVIGSEGAEDDKGRRKPDAEKMKIAWRYERLGAGEGSAAARRGASSLLYTLVYNVDSQFHCFLIQRHSSP